MKSLPLRAGTVEIRRAVPDDSDVICALILEAFSPFREQYTDGAFEYTTPGTEIIRNRFSEGPMWLALQDRLPVATVSGLPEGERFYIRSMAVSPHAQRAGIGQRLLDAVELHARDNGFKRLYLYTTFVLPGAKRLYEKNGFYVLRETQPEEWFEMGGLEMERDIS